MLYCSRLRSPQITSYWRFTCLICVTHLTVSIIIRHQRVEQNHQNQQVSHLHCIVHVVKLQSYTLPIYKLFFFLIGCIFWSWAWNVKNKMATRLTYTIESETNAYKWHKTNALFGWLTLIGGVLLYPLTSRGYIPVSTWFFSPQS